ncbi:hypothetical protein [Ralstonia pseudosolanacearum]|uniref:Uncharacterized protein n=2 Tax=Ralstonia solanacearum TaxID=305 RepID=A0ABY6NGP6_RALSL|nr:MULTISPECIES: hypothetical protein [Ralstonia]QWQ13321.1 hypothetical protein KN198_07740 [Ralstonia solanacearum]UZF16446.1 hypothetical protein LH706_08455 [Ralstonia solanacearum]UZF26493.1 hypothetical protein LGV80_08245 [Ralstonia sp. RS642]UZF31519.1 hypothetical protein LGV82_08090 [Ralstonia sp. RS650]
MYVKAHSMPCAKMESRTPSGGCVAGQPGATRAGACARFADRLRRIEGARVPSRSMPRAYVPVVDGTVTLANCLRDPKASRVAYEAAWIVRVVEANAGGRAGRWLAFGRSLSGGAGTCSFARGISWKQS